MDSLFRDAGNGKLGIMGSHNLSSQLRVQRALAYAQQRMNKGQLRKKLSQQIPSSSVRRTSCVKPRFAFEPKWEIKLRF